LGAAEYFRLSRSGARLEYREPGAVSTDRTEAIWSKGCAGLP
jgi:hypothetical protein